MAVQVNASDFPMFIDGTHAPSTSGRWIEVLALHDLRGQARVTT